MMLRLLTLVFMAGALAVYAVFHSPARDLIAGMVGIRAARCYFLCGSWPIGYDPADAVAAILLIVSATASGIITVRRMPFQGYERPAAAGLAALAFAVVPAAILGLIGWGTETALLKPPAGPAICAIPALVVAFCRRGVYEWEPVRVRRTDWITKTVAGVALVLIGATVLVAALHPPTGYDALSYHAPLGVLFWSDGDLGSFLSRNPEYPSLAHPGTSELVLGLFRLIGGEPLANIGQLPFGLLGAAAVYAFARRLGASASGGYLSAAAFLCAPIVVMQSGAQLNDLTGGALMMCVVALASAPPKRWSGSRMLIIGVGLGLAISTKLLLVPTASFMVFYLIACSAFMSRMTSLERLTRPAVAVGTMLIVAAPWLVRNTILFSNPVYPAAIPLVAKGFVPSDMGSKDREFVPTKAIWPMYPMLEAHGDQSGFGALFAVAAVPGVLLRMTRRKRNADRLFFLLALFALPAWWFTTMHEPRFLVTLVGLAFAFIPWTIAIFARKWRKPAGVLVVAAAIFSAAVTFDQAILPLARQPLERGAYFDQGWGVDPVVFGLDDSPIFLQNGLAPRSYASYYALMGAHLRRRVIAVDTDVSASALAAWMRNSGGKYAYVPVSHKHEESVRSTFSRHFDLVHFSAAGSSGYPDVVRFVYKLR